MVPVVEMWTDGACKGNPGPGGWGALLRSGARIAEMNCVRKHLSAIKGGRLAAASRAPVVTLLISDVPGDDPAVVGSGPTLPDPTTFADAVAIAGHVDGVPTGVRAYLERGAEGMEPETIKPGDPRLTATSYEILGNRLTALPGA